MTIEDVNEFVLCIKNNDEQGVVNLAKRLEIQFKEPEEAVLVILDVMQKNEVLISFFKEAMKKDGEIARVGAYYIRNATIAKEFLENKEEYGFSTHEIAELVATTGDINLIKQAIEDRDEYGFLSYQLRDIILASNNQEYIREIIQNNEMYGFNAFDLAEMILFSQDKQLLQRCIDNPEEYGFDPYTMVHVILEGIEDKEFLKDYIEKRGKYEYSGSDLAAIIIATQDVEYIKSCVENTSINYTFAGLDFAKLIASTHDSEYIKECIQVKEKYNLGSNNLKYLIISSKDVELMKEFVYASKENGITSGCVKEIIIATQDVEFMKACVKEHEKYGLKEPFVAEIIAATQDEKYIKECISIGEKIGLDGKHIAILALKTNNEEHIVDNIVEKETDKKIKLPPNMTIGIEIECEGEASDTIEQSSEIIAKDWKCKSDGSLEDGVEVVSPILRSEENAENDINRVCSILKACGQETSERCGGHIHIGADYLTCVESYMVLSEIWSNSEKILYKICNERGTMPRNNTAQFASPISQKIEEAMKEGEIDLTDSKDIDEFVESIKSIQKYRYSGINFLNVGLAGKNTIEFRLPNGTINRDTWIENINLFGGIIVAAEEISLIQKNSRVELSEIEKNKLAAYERILNSEIDEREKLEALLELVVPEDIQTFLERYEENEKLAKNSDVMSKVYSQVAKEPIILTKKGIKEAVLEGEDAITGDEYKKWEEIINSETKEWENLIGWI